MDEYILKEDFEEYVEDRKYELKELQQRIKDVNERILFVEASLLEIRGI